MPWTVRLQVRENEIPIAIKEILKLTQDYNLSYRNPNVEIFVHLNDVMKCLEFTKNLDSTLKRKVGNSIFEDSRKPRDVH